jgi:hypothetical protein
VPPREPSSTYRRAVLARFVYLDTVALGQYLAALEGGLLSESTRRSRRSGTGSGGVDAKVVQARGERTSEQEESQTVADTDSARFARLLKAAGDDPEALGWIEVLDPEEDFQDVGIGAMVAWECDIFIPDIVQAMARSGEALPAISMLQRLAPAAEALGLDTGDVPDVKQMEAASSFISGLGAQLVAVGEDEDTEWRVAGRVLDEHLHGDIDGRARVVGKVEKIIRPGRWQPYLTFPGMKVIGREARRKMERQGPGSREEDQYLPGPALMLDILAIYR